MGFEMPNNDEKVTSSFLKNYDKVAILESGVSVEISGSERIANLFFELYQPFGNKYGYNAKNISEGKLLETLNNAGITEEDIDRVFHSGIGELGKNGLKVNKDILLSNNPELDAIRDKVAGVFGGLKITA